MAWRRHAGWLAGWLFGAEAGAASLLRDRQGRRGGANRQGVPTDGTAGSKAGRGVCWRVREKNAGPEDSWWAGLRWSSKQSSDQVPVGLLRPWVKKEPGGEEETPGQPGTEARSQAGAVEGSWVGAGTQGQSSAPLWASVSSLAHSDRRDDH